MNANLLTTFNIGVVDGCSTMCHVLTSLAVVSSKATRTSAEISSNVVDTDSAISARVARTFIYICTYEQIAQCTQQGTVAV